MDRKLMAGPRVRRLRKDFDLTQAQMAEAMGVSASYINLIERNQRPVTAQFLLRLGETYDVDLKAFAGADDARQVAALRDVFADPALAAHPVEQQDLRDLAAASPAAAEAVIALHAAYRDV
ncbi:MAG: helix-turn-helix transcriptional regulator, partial [Pseudomonadota bacterium]